MLSHPVPVVALVSRYLTNKHDRTQTDLQVKSHLWSLDIIRYYPQFPVAIPDLKARIYVLLSLTPLSPLRGTRTTCMPNPRRQRSF